VLLFGRSESVHEKKLLLGRREMWEYKRGTGAARGQDGHEA
jgi:hypothetical protein